MTQLPMGDELCGRCSCKEMMLTRTEHKRDVWHFCNGERPRRWFAQGVLGVIFQGSREGRGGDFGRGPAQTRLRASGAGKPLVGGGERTYRLACGHSTSRA